jgi:hypothetical protein
MHVTIDGTLKPDGSLELDEKPSLSPGRVRITVEAINQSSSHKDPIGVLQQIRAQRQALAMPSPSQQEIDADVASMRDEWEQRQRVFDELRSEADQP